MRVLVISDNEFLIKEFKAIVSREAFASYSFIYKCSKIRKQTDPDFSQFDEYPSIDIKKDVQWVIKNFNLIISAHCKQIFPKEIVEKVRCINVHPGLNPFNRGWFPQVFSILNGLPAGATIHEIDTELDHGPIIAQKEVAIENYDTSLTAYNKIQQAEVELLNEHLLSILKKTYKSSIPVEEGNVNFKKDFDNLCKIDLQHTDTFENHLNKLRALTHGDYKNAYYYDKAANRKIFVSVQFEISE